MTPVNYMPAWLTCKDVIAIKVNSSNNYPIHTSTLAVLHCELHSSNFFPLNIQYTNYI